MNNGSALFVLFPEEFLPKYVKEAKDIYKHRALLKQLLASEYPINYLADIIIKAVDENTRFRTLDCLKVVKTILWNNPFNRVLTTQTTHKLFYLYKTFVAHPNEQVQACANNLVRFQTLIDEDIEWLISNWQGSTHSLNRLLRYPQMHLLITEWASKIYVEGLLPRRVSEVVALLIGDNVPHFITEDDDIVIWAIYYARVSNETKQKLLIEKFSLDNLETLWDVTSKLGYERVIELMQARIIELAESKSS